ncbi:MAG: Gfo/Idh/MocA family oxidoreductase [Mobilitalea sp.]
MKVALIGAGQVARVTHIPNYQGMEEVEVVAICDTNLESAKNLATQFGIPHYYNNHRVMLAEIKPDITGVCVPNKFHAAITVDALEAGSHVLCEKPPAISFEEAKQMERAAEKNNRLLSYGFHLRHDSRVSFLKEKIKQGDFGEMYAAKVSWLRRRGIPGWGSFTNKAVQGGGPLIDIGVHVLDIALYLLDYPQISYVCADFYNKIGTKGGTGLFGAWDGNTYSVEDSLFGYIHFQNGGSLRVETSFALHMKEKDIRSVQLFGDKLGAEVFPLEIYGVDGSRLTNQEYPFMAEEDLHKKELEHFVRACQGRETLLVKAKEGTYLQKVIEALYESADKKQPVIVDSLIE